MTDLIILAGSLGLTAAIVWWFFGKPQQDVVAAEVQGDTQRVDITVDGSYIPNRVQLRKGIPAKLVFTRKDASSCFDEVILPDFGVQTKLPVNKSYEIEVKPDKPGVYKYSCGMHMFFGEIIVK